MVAIKRLDCDVNEEMLHQMRREALILQRVANHPNVVQFYGTCPGNPPTICMEYMEVSIPIGDLAHLHDLFTESCTPLAHFQKERLIILLFPHARE